MRKLALSFPQTCVLMHVFFLQLCGGRIAGGLQLSCSIEGACRAGAGPMPCSSGGARPVGVGIRCSDRAGAARALLAIRGTGDPRPRTGGPRRSGERAALGREHEEAEGRGGDGAHARTTGPPRAAAGGRWGYDGPRPTIAAGLQRQQERIWHPQLPLHVCAVCTFARTKRRRMW